MLSPEYALQKIIIDSIHFHSYISNYLRNSRLSNPVHNLQSIINSVANLVEILQWNDHLTDYLWLEFLCFKVITEENEMNYTKLKRKIIPSLINYVDLSTFKCLEWIMCTMDYDYIIND